MKVIKGHLVPLRNSEGGVLLVEEAPSSDFFREYLSKLKNFLHSAVKLSGEARSPEERLELVADLIACFYRAPLLAEPIRGVHLSPFKVYLMYRILRVLNGPDDRPVSNLLRKSEEGKLDYTDEQIKKQFKEQLFDLVENSFDISEKVMIGYPADTRPGYNLSSLLVHWISVSALAWSLGEQRDLNRRELARIRIASLLHDIGKPLNPKAHVEAGRKEAEDILKGLIDVQDLDAVLEIIASHHGEYEGPYSREVDAIKQADRFSSNMDRLDHVVEEVVLGEISSIMGMGKEDVRENFYWSGKWDSWEKLVEKREGIIEELTEKCVRHLISRGGAIEEDKPLTGISLIKLDVGGIQDFIRESEKLPLLAASSYIIDLAVIFNSLRAVQEILLEKCGVWYPMEGFLYSAGGNILAVSPDNIIDQMTEALKRAFSKEGRYSLGFGPLSVRIASTQMRSNYAAMMEDLDLKLMRSKLSLAEPLRPSEDLWWSTKEELLTGIERVCDYCKKRPAVDTISMGEEEYYVCDECKKRYELYKYEGGHFRSRWKDGVTESKRTVGEALDAWNRATWDVVKNYLMEIISGHDSKEELEKERLLNLAILKVDGNLMGAFMAQSISLSDALERSARIDLALKKAFKTALKAMNDGLGEEASKEEARLLLGIQYMGGDDSLLLCPSWASIPLSIVLMIEFAREMGYSFLEGQCISTGATLSIGLVSAPARHNIWAMIDAANRLLEVAKEAGRYPTFMGAIAFDCVEGGLLTGLAADSRREVLKSLGITSQPWVLGPVADVDCDILRAFRKDKTVAVRVEYPRKCLNLVRAISGMLGLETIGTDRPWGSSDEDLLKMYRELFRKAHEEFLAGRKGKRSRITELRNLIRKVEAFPSRYGVSLGGRDYLTLAGLYAIAEARKDGEERELFKVIADAISPGAFALEDLIRVCKILLGGAR